MKILVLKKMFQYSSIYSGAKTGDLVAMHSWFN